MAKGTFRLDKIWENFVENEMDTIGAFRALEVEKGLLTIKPQDFIKKARCRRIYFCRKMSKENWVATAAISFLLTILPPPLSNLHHRACPAPTTTISLRKAGFE